MLFDGDTKAGEGKRRIGQEGVGFDCPLLPRSVYDPF